MANKARYVLKIIHNVLVKLTIDREVFNSQTIFDENNLFIDGIVHLHRDNYSTDHTRIVFEGFVDDLYTNPSVTIIQSVEKLFGPPYKE